MSKTTVPVATTPGGAVVFSGEAGWVIADFLRKPPGPPPTRIAFANSYTLWARARRATWRAAVASFVLFPGLLFAALWLFAPSRHALTSKPWVLAALLFGLPLASLVVVVPVLLLGYVLPARRASNRPLECELTPSRIRITSGNDVLADAAWEATTIESVDVWIHPRWGRGVVESIALLVPTAESRAPHRLELRRTDARGGAAALFAALEALRRANRLLLRNE